ncbi:MAG TPA: fatty acid oxidation complex subunit alpha FadJ [Acidobacteriota bacterium]|nr:fatty acid oxidation complex subunit alpha FadJ [Acidobacteriota bacterium]
MSFISKEIDRGVALLWMDQPGEKLNTLSYKLLDEFGALLDELERDSNVKAVVLISAKDENFIAGADIKEFSQLDTAEKAAEASRSGQEMLDRLEGFEKPVLAAVNGAALGGGLEIALACHYRIATTHSKTHFGLPEVKLGLLPGAGGTQRLPRRVGLAKSLPLLLTGKNVYPYPAKKMGLVDELIHPPGLAHAAVQAGLRLADGKKPKGKGRGLLGWLLEGNRLGRAIVFRKARQQTRRQTYGNYPAPPRIIEVVKTGLDQGMKAGLKAEAKAFGELMQTPESQELTRLFFAMTSDKKKWDEKARPVKVLGVLGAGLMGSGISQVSADKGYQVFMKDLDQESVAKGEKAVYDDLQSKVRKRAMTEFERDRLMSRIHPVTSYRGFDRVNLVIEAVFEDLDLKRKILDEVEEATGGDTIFASNTSAIPISDIARRAKRPQNIVGMHYFSPVPKMPLLEIIATDKTAEWVVHTAAQVGVRQGKTVIVVGDGPGFYTTRILAPMMNEALLLLEEGAAVEQLDKTMKQWGFPVGPVTLMDEVGIDVGAHVSETLGQAFSDRGATPSGMMHKLVREGYKGKKNRKGFYLYPKKKKKGKKQVNTKVYDHFGGQRRKRFEEEEIENRLSLVMINEAALCLQEEILRSPKDGDLGAILGLGFPPFRGGPFRYLDRLGVDNAASRLQSLQDQHGARFAPAQILLDYAESKRRFYPQG